MQVFNVLQHQQQVRSSKQNTKSSGATNAGLRQIYVTNSAWLRSGHQGPDWKKWAGSVCVSVQPITHSKSSRSSLFFLIDYQQCLAKTICFCTYKRISCSERRFLHTSRNNLVPLKWNLVPSRWEGPSWGAVAAKLQQTSVTGIPLLRRECRLSCWGWGCFRSRVPGRSAQCPEVCWSRSLSPSLVRLQSTSVPSTEKTKVQRKWNPSHVVVPRSRTGSYI